MLAMLRMLTTRRIRVELRIGGLWPAQMLQPAQPFGFRDFKPRGLRRKLGHRSSMAYTRVMIA